MTEKVWLTATDWHTLFAMVWDRITERKLRLLACGIARQFCDPITDPRSRAAIETAEAHADRVATPAQLGLAALEAQKALAELEAMMSKTYRTQYPDDNSRLRVIGRLSQQIMTGDRACWAARVYLDRLFNCRSVFGQPNLLYDIFPNPFRPVSLDPAWLHWRDRTVLRLATSIYATQDFSGLPMLADALEEAGCTDATLLTHCRGPVHHVRGCWALDLLMGRDGTQGPHTQILRDQRPGAYWTVQHPMEVTGQHSWQLRPERQYGEHRYLGSVEVTGQHSRQLAQLTLRFEPSSNPEAILLVNDLSDDRMDKDDRAALPSYLMGISQGVCQGLDALEEGGRPIAGLRLVLSDVRSPLVASSVHLFCIAARNAIQNAFATGRFVQVSES